MIVHQVYALIFENIIQNVCVCDDYEMANFIARASYGEEAFAVDCLQYPCNIGDKYRDGIFYSVHPETYEETIIQYVPTQEQQVETLSNELTSTQLALTESYEENLALKDELINTQEELTNTQLALCELYEAFAI